MAKVKKGHKRCKYSGGYFSHNKKNCACCTKESTALKSYTKNGAYSIYRLPQPKTPDAKVAKKGAYCKSYFKL